MIQLLNVVKKFKGVDKNNKPNFKIAVDNVTLTIRRNEIFGLLGKNGAGKTTLIKMLTGQTAPTSGEILYNGKSFNENPAEIKKILGVVPQHINFDQELNVEENLELHARLYGLEKSARQTRITELLKYMELEDCRKYNVKKLSGGMKRRLLIARALIHRPQILFLDEPTVALDPQVRRRIWNLIEELAKNGVTIILTTHYIEEAESLCQRAAIIDIGKLISENTPCGFCESLGAFTVDIIGAAGKSCKFFQDEKSAEIWASSLTENFKIRQTNLEDVFVELTGRRSDL